MRRALLYASLGGLLAWGAPLGWLTLRRISGQAPDLALELERQWAVYAYLLLGTLAAFVAFGAYVGKVVAALEHANGRLALLALVDPLTALGNRREFEVRLSEACAQAARADTDLSLISLDLDHFKRVNDSLGHPAGDAVLIAVARVLRRTVRGADVAFRTGGEEFAVLCPLTAEHDAAALAERLRRAVESSPVVTREGRVELTASFGVAHARGARAEEALVEAADRALYEAKRRGRNQVVVEGEVEIRRSS